MSATNFQAEAEKLRGVLAHSDEPVTGTTMFQNVAAKLRSTMIGSTTEQTTADAAAVAAAEDWHDLETPPAVHIPDFGGETAKLREAHTSGSDEFVSEAEKLRQTHTVALKEASVENDKLREAYTSAGGDAKYVDMVKRGNLFGEAGTLINYRSGPSESASQTQYAESHVLDDAPTVKAALPADDLSVKNPSVKHTHFNEAEATSTQSSHIPLASATSHDACAVCVQRHNSEHHARHSTDLQDSAAMAALYVKRSQPPVGRSLKETYITPDNKLSSAGAAASLKYASPKDLPSFPSTGLNHSAAGTAASLGWNSKSVEAWPKPDSSSAAASKAAMLAKDYKMQPLWKPEESSNGAKAALLAHKDGGKVDIWLPSASKEGHSAATIAMRNGKNNALSPQIDRGYTDMGRSRSLMAASGAVSENNRRLADNTPVINPERYPDEHKASANALSAASRANKNDLAYRADRGSTSVVSMPREFLTSNPPFVYDGDEKAHQDGLHASAVAMAKKMYSMQQDQYAATSKAQGLSGASAAHSRNRDADSDDEEVAPMRFNNLQEAAQRLAQERLARLHDEHAQAREYRGYYGQDKGVGSRKSILGSRSGRSTEELDDNAQAQKIRQQSSLFTSSLSQVDSKKRQADRDALMAAAQRNVTARLSTMDQEVFRDTGKVSASMLDEWEVKAHAAAQKNSESRMENYGKVNIGGGKFIDQAAIDLVARKRVQPLLDEISEKAEAQRLRDAEIKLEQENRKREEELKKTREREAKQASKALKANDKEEAKAKKLEEKRAKDLAKQREYEANKAKREAATANSPATIGVPVTTTRTAGSEEITSPTSTELPDSPMEEPHRSADRHPVGYVATTDLATTPDTHHERASAPVEVKSGLPAPVPGSSSSNTETTKKSSWYKRFSSSGQDNRQSKGKFSAAGVGSKSTVPEEPSTSATTTPAKTTAASATPVMAVGAGAAAVGGTAVIASRESVDENRGRRAERDISPVSSISSMHSDAESDEEFEEARDNFDDSLAPPPTFVADKSTSPSRASKFTEVV